MPVEGPPRCTLMITAGTSAKEARPMNSVISEMPGPDVLVKAREPFQPAPIAMLPDPVAAEIERLDVGIQELLLALELLAEQPLDLVLVDVEQHRQRADI